MERYSGINTNFFLHFSDWKSDVRKLSEISNDIKTRTTCDRSHIRRSSVGIVQPFAAATAPSHLFLSAVIVYSSRRVKNVRYSYGVSVSGVLEVSYSAEYILPLTRSCIFVSTTHVRENLFSYPLPLLHHIYTLLPTCLLDLNAFFYRTVFRWYCLFDINFLLNIAPFSLSALILDHISAAQKAIRVTNDSWKYNVFTFQ